MGSKVNMQLYSSLCPKNEYYLARIKTLAERFGISYALDWITEEDEMRKRGISVLCAEHYCPGCTIMHPPGQSGVCAPALVINDKLWFWNCPPSDEMLEKALREYLLD